MSEPTISGSAMPGKRGPIEREEFETFLHEFTHDIRNQLNIIALEAADMADQIGSPMIAGRLQKRVQDCSVYLKKIRESLAPNDPGAAPIALNDFAQLARDCKAAKAHHDD